MTSLRVGVVGVGHLGYHHARNYHELDGVELAGVVDCDAGHAKKAATDFSTTPFSTVDELLEAGIDAASVVVPTTDHHSVTLALLDGGVDVLVEKPIALSADQAEEMAERAATRDRILQVGHIERFNGAVIALFESVKQPLFIECHRLSPYPERSTDVSVVLDLMIHDLDIVRALVGSEVVSVDAVGVPVFSGQEDIANVRIRFASGCVANITASRVSVERMRKIRIFAENAYVSTDYSAQEVLVYRKKGGAPAPDASPMDQIAVEPLTVKHDEPLKLELAAFAECVSKRTAPAVSGRDAIEALKLAQQIETFIREHR